MKNYKSNLQKVTEKINRIYSDYSDIEKQRIINQMFAKVIVNGATIGKNGNTGKLYTIKHETSNQTTTKCRLSGK